MKSFAKIINNFLLALNNSLINLAIKISLHGRCNLVNLWFMLFYETKE